MCVVLQIPVYIGCNDPLLGNKKPQSDYHGSDGLGDAPDPGAPDDSHLKQEHAVEALIRMSKEYAGKYLSVCQPCAMLFFDLIDDWR